MLQAGTLIKNDWLKTQEGKETIMSIMHKNMHSRKQFGLLEKPSLASHLKANEVSYKIFVSGKSGVGKTSTVAKLSGTEVPTSHCETAGIQTSVVYWPAKLVETERIIIFRLEFWDAGEGALKKFDHILSACKENADAILFLFSFTDKFSFDDLPQQMSRIVEPAENPCRIVLGTKYDLHSMADVTQKNVRDFESYWKIPILKIRNLVNYNCSEIKTDLNEVAPILNYISEMLWLRDQVLAGVSKDKSAFRSQEPCISFI